MSIRSKLPTAFCPACSEIFFSGFAVSVSTGPPLSVWVSSPWVASVICGPLANVFDGLGMTADSASLASDDPDESPPMPRTRVPDEGDAAQHQPDHDRDGDQGDQPGQHRVLAPRPLVVAHAAILTDRPRLAKFWSQKPRVQTTCSCSRRDRQPASVRANVWW